MQRASTNLVGAAALALALTTGSAAQPQPRGTVIHAAFAPNLCVDVSRGNPAGGTKVQLWTCTGDFPQRFTFDAAKGLIRMAAYPNSCIDQEQGGGNKMEVTECQYAWSKWRYDAGSGRIINNRNSCLNWGLKSFAGVRLEAYPCANANSMKFALADR